MKRLKTNACFFFIFSNDESRPHTRAKSQQFRGPGTTPGQQPITQNTLSPLKATKVSSQIHAATAAALKDLKDPTNQGVCKRTTRSSTINKRYYFYFSSCFSTTMLKGLEFIVLRI